MEDALLSIDEDDIDLTPMWLTSTTRNPERPKMISSSVVKPCYPRLPQERQLLFQEEIDYDCDQVRAMIKIFVTDGEWTLDEFRKTLGKVSRQQMTKFLKQTGSDSHQLMSAAYQLSWEFFNWRDQMGLPLSGACVAEDIVKSHEWFEALEDPDDDEPLEDPSHEEMRTSWDHQCEKLLAEARSEIAKREYAKEQAESAAEKASESTEGAHKSPKRVATESGEAEPKSKRQKTKKKAGPPALREIVNGAD
jgi:hypothetical protein